MDTDSFTADAFSTFHLDSLTLVSPIMKHILASNHVSSNAFGAKVLVDTPLNITAWDSRLQDYHDENVVKFLCYGWPINYTADKLPESSASNHPSAITADAFSTFHLDSLTLVSPIMKHILASNHVSSNAFGAKVLVDTPLNITAWDSRLQDYHDENVVKFLR